MTADLQTRLRTLAEKAGYYVRPAYNKPKLGVYSHPEHDSGYFQGYLPGADGTLTDAECWLVLGWLAKAGYWVTVKHNESFGFIVVIDEFEAFDEPATTVSGMPLSAALEAALLAMPVEVTG